MESTLVKENEIRPDNIQVEYATKYAADVAWLLDRQNDFIDVPCPACGCSDRHLLFNKDGFQYQTCISCETAYISPRPTSAVLSSFYPASQVGNLFHDRIFPASQETRRQQFFIPRVKRIIDTCREICLAEPVLLEVGAGFGIFCEEASRSNFFSRVIAVEPNIKLASKCRVRGFDVINQMIEDVKKEEVGDIDIICSFEVFEHLPEPRKFLSDCRKLLKNKGLLVLTCPNGKGFDLKMLGAISDTYNVQHLNYFNPQSIRILLDSERFKVLRISTPGKLDVNLVRKRVLCGHIDIPQTDFLYQILGSDSEKIASAFQTFLADNQLSGHMEVIAQLYE